MRVTLAGRPQPVLPLRDVQGAVADPARTVAVRRALRHVAGLRTELDAVASLAAQLLGTEVGLVCLLDEREQSYVGRSDPGLPELLDLPAEQLQCAHVVAADAPLVVPDVLVDPGFARHPAAESGLLRFYAGAPVRDEDGQVLGTVCAIGASPRSEVPDQLVQALVDLAREVSTLLLLARRDAEQQLHRSVLSSIAAARPLPETLELLCRQVEGLLGREAACTVHLLDERRGVLHDLVAPSLPAAFREHIATVPVAAGPGTCGEAARTRSTAVIEDVSTCPHEGLQRRFGAHGLAAVASLPVLDPATGAVLGVFALYRYAPGAPTPYEWTTLHQVRDLAGVAITRSRLDQELVRLATQDTLTGLLNRRAFLSEAAGVLDAEPVPGTEHVVLFCDLDRFGELNDTIGHSAGDACLVAAGQALAASLRPGDLAARYGGDVFAVLAHDVPAGAVHDLARRVSGALAVPVQVVGHDLRLTCSAGVTTTGVSGAAIDRMLVDADLAMRAAKSSGRDRVVVCDTALRARASESNDLVLALRDALRAGELSVAYQVEVDLAADRVVGLEALCRWDRPGHGAVSPAAFIPAAEQSGLIGELGHAVLSRALTDLAHLRDRLPSARDLVVWVNVSVQQIDDALVRTVEHRLHVLGLPPTCLGIEVTESTVMEDPEAASRVLERLRAVGVRVAIDDFGTGWSSLGLLKHLPVDALKIDRSFVTGLARTGSDRQLVSAILAMASALGLTVIAEGVETEEQREVLRELGCPTAQGYLLGRPQPVEVLRARLAAGA